MSKQDLLSLLVALVLIPIVSYFNIRWIIKTKEVVSVKHLIPLIIVVTLALLCWIWVFPKIFAFFGVH